jgi:lipoate-protein ligase B
LVWAWQKRLAGALAEGQGPDRLLLCEHEPVITLGRRASAKDVLVDDDRLDRLGIVRRVVERGGAATYHGPGQLVAYPILDLRRHRKDVRWLSETLGQVAVDCLADFGVAADLRTGSETGVWTNQGKIAALGLRVERWVSYHGLALNVCTDLAPFGLIVPCAAPGASTDSLARHLQPVPSMSAVRDAFLRAFACRFGITLRRSARPAFLRPAAASRR